MKTLAAALSFLFVAGCAPAISPERPAREPTPRIPSVSPYPALKYAVDALLPDSLFPPSNAAVRIVSLSEGETLYQSAVRSAVELLGGAQTGDIGDRGQEFVQFERRILEFEPSGFNFGEVQDLTDEHEEVVAALLDGLHTA